MITIGDSMRHMQIRIVPMSFEDEEFKGKDLEYVQKIFFCKTLINEQGWYQFKEKGLVADEGDLLLFQMSNSIIASAELIKSERFARKIGDYCGAFWLKCSTIKIFDPILPDELKTMIPGFKSFNEVKQSFSIEEVDMDKLEPRMNIYSG